MNIKMDQFKMNKEVAYIQGMSQGNHYYCVWDNTTDTRDHEIAHIYINRDRQHFCGC
jgi:hypothetical protein